MSEQQNLTQRLIFLIEQLTGAPSPNSLSDVHAAVAAILGPEEAQVSLATLLTGLLGAPAASLADLRTSIIALRGVEDATLSDLLTTDEYVNAQIQLNSKLVTVIDQLDALNSAIGGVPYQDLERVSVRGLLYAILTALNVMVRGELPTGDKDEMSDGIEIVAGRKYATFDGPIDGVTIASNKYDLTANWSNWQAYIQTTDPAPQIAGATDVPNAWLNLAGNGTINFSVAGQYPISVSLRYPPPITSYVWNSADIPSVSTGFGPRWQLSNTKYSIPTSNYSGPLYQFALDVGGWTWNITGGPDPYIYWGIGGNGVSTGSPVQTRAKSGTFPANVTHFVILSDNGAWSSVTLTAP